MLDCPFKVRFFCSQPDNSYHPISALGRLDYYVSMFNFPQLHSASWIRTTSPSLKVICLDFSFMCLSLRDFRYSPLHRFHKTSLHQHRYFTLFLKSAFPSSVLSSGTSLGWPNIMVHGVKTASWMSSSKWQRTIIQCYFYIQQDFLKLIPCQARSTNTLVQCLFYDAHQVPLKLTAPPPSPPP